MPTTQDYEIRIRAAGADGAYPIEVSGPAELEGRLRLPFATGEVERFIADCASGLAGEEQIADFGRRLGDALFSADMTLLLGKQLAGTSAGVRVRLRVDAPELAALPWEFLHSVEADGFAALSPRITLSRYLPLGTPPEPLRVEGSLRVLVVCAGPSDMPPIDTAATAARIQAALAPLTETLDVRVLEHATLAQLQDALRDGPHVLHFAGHGTFDEQTGQGALAFEAPDGASDWVTAEVLGNLLRDGTVRLAYLDACLSGAAAGPRPVPGLSVAQALIQAGIPAVLAMRFEVPDYAAQVFAAEFYAALMDGYTVDAAIAEGRRAVLREGPAIWGIPLLFSRAREGYLFTLPEGAGAPADVPCPFKGLQAFQEEDAPYFFGREALVERMARLLAPGGETENRFLAVIGPSGSGKSSAVRAGLLPALRAGKLIPGSDTWPIYVITPTQQPLEALAAALARNEPSVLAAVTLRNDLHASSETLHFAARRALAGSDSLRRFVVVVDQFEEIFTLCADEVARNQFVANLLHAAQVEGGQAIVVLTLRADFYPKAAQYPSIAAQITDPQVLVSPMTPDELRGAIEKPAAKVGLRYAPGLVDTILADVAQQPGALPLLSHALLELYAARRGRTLTLAAYLTAGGVRGAIARRADTIYAGFNAEQQEVMRWLMLRLTQPGEGTEDTRRRARMEEFDLAAGVVTEQENQIAQVIQALSDARLVIVDAQSVEVAHEALIRNWPRMQQWLDADREGQRLRTRLSRDAQEWEEHDRDAGLLYRGARLATMNEWAEKHAGDLSATEREFLTRAQAEASREAVEREAQRRRELEAARKLAEESEARRKAEEARAREQVEAARMLAEESEARHKAEEARAREQVEAANQLAEQSAAREREQTQAAERLRARNRIAVGLTVIAALLAVVAFSLFATANQAQQSEALQRATAQAASTAAVAQQAVAQNSAATAQAANTVAVAEQARAQNSAATAQAASTAAVAAQADAENQARVARVRELAALSTSNLARRFDIGLLLSVESSLRLDTLYATRGALVDAIRFNPVFNQMRRLRGHGSVVWSVAFSPDGRTVASGSYDDTIILWDAATQQPISQLRGHAGSVNSVGFSPDGTILASASDDNTVILWNVATQQPIGQLTGHTAAVWGVAFSPDRTILASGSDDNTIILWDVATQQPIGQPLTGHSGWVRGVAFSPDGRTLASGSSDNTIILWDVATQQPIRPPLIGHTNWVNRVAFSPDGQTLASGGHDGVIRLWDVASGRSLSVLTGHTSSVYGVAFSPDGRTLASASVDSTIRLWDAASHQVIAQPLTGHTSGVYGVAFSPDGRTLASASYDDTVILWDMTARQPVGQTLSGHQAAVTRVAFSPDGRILASGSSDTTIILWDVASRRAIGQLTGHTGVIAGLAFSPDGKTIASGSSDTTIILWDAASRRAIGQLTGHTDMVWSLAFSPDGQTLASASFDNTIILWDVASRQPIGRPLTGHTYLVKSVAFSPDGKTLASGSWDDTVILWDVASQQPIGQPLIGPTSGVESVAFSPDGTVLAVATGNSATIILWDVASRQPIGQPLTGHASITLNVAFSPDGRTIASSSWDTTVILWDVASHQPIGLPLAGHTEPVYGVAFSPDGKTVASAGNDGTVVLWDVDPASWRARACAIAGRSFTRDEWARYFPDEAYRATCSEWPPAP